MTPRRKGLHEIQKIRLGNDREHEQSQDAVRLNTALGWGYGGRVICCNLETLSDISGTTRHGVKLC
jgi:hypothetical protein